MPYLKEEQHQSKITWVEMYNIFNHTDRTPEWKEEIKFHIKESSPTLYHMITNKPGQEVLDYYNDYNSVVVLQYSYIEEW